MARDIERRLEALEGRAVTNQRGTLPGLLALYAAGLLDVPNFTDQELWWVIAGKEEPMPDDAEVERRLADAVEQVACVHM